MRLAITLACFVCLADGCAQSGEPLNAIVYPPLAAAARVQGDVLISDGAFTGPPLLRQAALRGIELLKSNPSQSGAMFHFVLVGTVQSTRTEKVVKGDAFDRVFLRILRIPVAKKIETRECTERPNIPANRIDTTKDPIEIWVYGRERCVMVSYTGTLVPS
jgi:hypothetical protein